MGCFPLVLGGKVCSPDRNRRCFLNTGRIQDGWCPSGCMISMRNMYTVHMWRQREYSICIHYIHLYISIFVLDVLGGTLVSGNELNYELDVPGPALSRKSWPVLKNRWTITLHQDGMLMSHLEWVQVKLHQNYSVWLSLLTIHLNSSIWWTAWTQPRHWFFQQHDVFVFQIFVDKAETVAIS